MRYLIRMSGKGWKLSGGSDMNFPAEGRNGLLELGTMKTNFSANFDESNQMKAASGLSVSTRSTWARHPEYP